MDNKEKKQYPDLTSEYFQSISMHDCTGLIPAGMTNNAEIEAYNEMYSFVPTSVELSKRYVE